MTSRYSTPGTIFVKQVASSVWMKRNNDHPWAKCPELGMMGRNKERGLRLVDLVEPTARENGVQEKPGACIHDRLLQEDTHIFLWCTSSPMCPPKEDDTTWYYCVDANKYSRIAKEGKMTLDWMISHSRRISLEDIMCCGICHNFYIPSEINLCSVCFTKQMCIAADVREELVQREFSGYIAGLVDNKQHKMLMSIIRE
jgi:hypothetical protein